VAVAAVGVVVIRGGLHHSEGHLPNVRIESHAIPPAPAVILGGRLRGESGDPSRPPSPQRAES
jgi:hypothetical protein